MNAKKWINYYEANGGTYEEPDWSRPCEITDDDQRRELARSLAIFQLGESGGGSRLRGYALDVANGRGRYVDAVDLFIAEECYHAELLAKMVEHLDGRLLKKQWTNSIFRGVRSLLNIEFNIQVLLVAELIARAYYAVLYERVPDGAIRDCCAKIVRDEVQHIAFHVDFFRERLGEWLPLQRQLWLAQFQLMFIIVQRVVWADHQKCFQSLGISKAEFTRKGRDACRGFLSALERHERPAPVGASPIAE